VVAKAANFKRGLLYVTSDGSYVYGAEESEQDGSTSIRMAMMMPLPLVNDIDLSFEDIYGSNQLPLLMIDYDWLEFRRLGHWVLSVGTAIAQASGPGHFIDDKSVANERYTFYIMLNHISFVYRFQYVPHPWVVPYLSVGGVPGLLVERRDDNKRNKSKFVPAVQASAGLRMNIVRLDSYGSASLDIEYGINNMWLDAEFRRIQSSGDVDISSNLINLGLGFDF
jgi:hypothetical protein